MSLKTEKLGVENGLMETAIMINNSHYSMVQESIKHTHFSNLYGIDKFIELFANKIDTAKKLEVELVISKLEEVAKHTQMIERKVSELSYNGESSTYNGRLFNKVDLCDNIPNKDFIRDILETTVSKHKKLSKKDIESGILNCRECACENTLEFMMNRYHSKGTLNCTISSDVIMDYKKTCIKNAECLSKDIKEICKILSKMKFLKVDYIDKDTNDNAMIINELLTNILILVAAKINFIWIQVKQIENICVNGKEV